MTGLTEKMPKASLISRQCRLPGGLMPLLILTTTPTIALLVIRIMIVLIIKYFSWTPVGILMRCAMLINMAREEQLFGALVLKMNASGNFITVTYLMKHWESNLLIFLPSAHLI